VYRLLFSVPIHSHIIFNHSGEFQYVEFFFFWSLETLTTHWVRFHCVRRFVSGWGRTELHAWRHNAVSVGIYKRETYNNKFDLKTEVVGRIVWHALSSGAALPAIMLLNYCCTVNRPSIIIIVHCQYTIIMSCIVNKTLPTVNLYYSIK